MTKKTYVQLAKEIARILALETPDTTHWQIISAMCDAMKSDNSAFDRTRFLDAIADEQTRILGKITATTPSRVEDERALQALTNQIVRGNG